MKRFCSCALRCINPNFGLFVLRFVTGLIFIYHGWLKFADISNAEAFFTSLGLPPLLVPVVGTIELLAGIALLLGVWTCLAAIALLVVAIGAIIFAKWPTGFSGMELELLLLAALIAIKGNGAGSFRVGSSCGCPCAWSNEKTCCDCRDGEDCKDCECHAK